MVFGALFIVTKKGSDLDNAIEVEGPMAVFVGGLLCLLGVWGLVRTIQEARKKEVPNQSPQPPPEAGLG